VTTRTENYFCTSWKAVVKFFNRLDAANPRLAFTLAGPVETGLPALSSIGGPVAGEAYQWRPVAIGAAASSPAALATGPAQPA
jgi:hypothetical protein